MFHANPQMREYIKLATNACGSDVYSAIDSALKMLQEACLKFIADGIGIASIREVDEHPVYSKSNPKLKTDHMELNDVYIKCNQQMEMMNNDD